MILSQNPPAAPGLFERLRHELLDNNGNAYTAELLAQLYNRAIEEIQPIVMVLGAPIGMKSGTITGDGSNQSFALPGDFRAFVPGRVLPRSPRTATTEYSYGEGLDHVDDTDPRISHVTTAVGDPGAFCLEVSGAGLSVAQRIKFSVIPYSGYIWDYRYWPTIPTITAGGATSSYTPWAGLLDPLINRTMAMLGRAGFEFQGSDREKWKIEAEIEAVRLLGLRKLNERGKGPSIFNVPGWGR